MLMIKLAMRNLLRNRRRTLMTLLSMLAGYLVVALVLSVEEGSYDQVLGYFTQDQTGHVQITAPEFLERPNLYRTVPADQSLLETLAAQSGVTAFTARLESGALAYGEDRSLPVEVRGIVPEREANLSMLADKLTAGRFLTDEMDEDGLFEAMIGAQAARQLQLDVGDELVLISQGADGSLANDLFRITAIIGQPDDAEGRWIVLPLHAAQAFFVLPEQAHRLVILGEDYRRSEALARQISAWSQARDDSTDWRVSPWQVVASDLYETMEADKEGSRFASYLLIFLVCIGVLNTVLMSVMERTGEFGVLKAIGTSPARLFSLIQLETQLLALFACALGFALALPLNWWLTEVGFSMADPIEVSGIVFSHYRGQMSLYVFLYPAVVIWLASWLVALYPGLRAARLSPVDAMRTL